MSQTMPKKSHLFDYHEKHGKLTEFSGFEMPLWYTSIIDEHLAVRNSAGLFDVSHMGRVAITGTGATDFLNHLVPTNCAKIREGRAFYTVLCSNNGGIIDDVITNKFTESKYMLVINAGNRDKDISWIKSISKNFDVTVEDFSESSALIAFQGPLTMKILQEKIEQDILGLKRFSFIECRVDGERCLVSRTGYTGEDGAEITIFDAPVDRPSRAHKPPLREPQDGQVRLSAGLRQRVGPRPLREAQSQVRRLPAPRASCPSPTTWFAGTSPAGTTTAAISSWASIPCSRTRPASSWRPISTRRTGRKTPAAFLETCRRMDLPAALERSRSGNGGHVWLFFAGGHPRRPGPQARLAHPDRDHGTPPGHRPGFLRPLLPQPRHAAPGRFRQPDRLAAAKATAGTAAIASSSTSSSLRIPINGRSCRGAGKIGASDRRGDRPRRRATRTDRRRAHGPGGRGRRRAVDRAALAPPQGAADRRAVAREPGTGPRRPDLHRQGAVAAGPPQSPAAAGGISEPRVLQGAGHAPADLRQAADHLLRRGPSAAHRPAARLPGRRAGAASRTCASRRSFATSDTRARRWTCSSKANCGRSKRPPPARCWPTTRASCRPRRPSERPWSPPG